MSELKREQLQELCAAIALLNQAVDCLATDKSIKFVSGEVTRILRGVLVESLKHDQTKEDKGAG